MSYRVLKNLFCLLLVSALIGCGEGTEETTRVPVATEPTSGPNGDLPTGTPPINQPGVPDFSKAVLLALSDTTTYGALYDLGSLFSVGFTPPLVGDPLISMNLEPQSNQGLNGSFLVGVEDAYGLMTLEAVSFPQTGSLTSTTFDIIFVEQAITFRARGTRSGNNLNGTITYRIRQSGDEACQAITVSCERVPVQYPGWGLPPSTGWNHPWEEDAFGNTCNQTPPDTATECRTYMNSSQSLVKELGQFSGNLTQW